MATNNGNNELAQSFTELALAAQTMAQAHYHQLLTAPIAAGHDAAPAPAAAAAIQEMGLTQETEDAIIAVLKETLAPINETLVPIKQSLRRLEAGLQNVIDQQALL